MQHFGKDSDSSEDNSTLENSIHKIRHMLHSKEDKTLDMVMQIGGNKWKKTEVMQTATTTKLYWLY